MPRETVQRRKQPPLNVGGVRRSATYHTRRHNSQPLQKETEAARLVRLGARAPGQRSWRLHSSAGLTKICYDLWTRFVVLRQLPSAVALLSQSLGGACRTEYSIPSLTGRPIAFVRYCRWAVSLTSAALGRWMCELSVCVGWSGSACFYLCYASTESTCRTRWNTWMMVAVTVILGK